MTPTDLAAPVKQVSLSVAEALLRDVPRFASPDGNLLAEEDVLAALSRALDPALTEQAAAELQDVMRCRCHEAYKGRGLHDPNCQCDSQDALNTILAQNAALRAERDRYLRHLTAGAESLNAYKARAEAAEAQIAALTARVEGLTGAVKGLVEILDQHETKGPLPDVALMFCWLAAQEVRAVMRKDGGQ